MRRIFRIAIVISGQNEQIRHVTGLCGAPLRLEPLPRKAVAAAIVDRDGLAVQFGFFDEAPMPAVEAVASMISQRKHHSFRDSLSRQVGTAAIRKVQQSLSLSEVADCLVCAGTRIQYTSVDREQAVLDRNDISA